MVNHMNSKNSSNSFMEEYDEILSKKTVNGELIKNRILQRKPNEGAIAVECTGIQGSGKTSLMLWFADAILHNDKQEYVFWRDSVDSPLQYNKIGNNRFKILVHNDTNIRFMNTETMQKANIPHYRFETMEDLYELSEPDKINAVYFPDDYMWIDLIKFLRLQPGWQSVFLDEYEDVCPQRCRGEQWHRNEWFGKNIKQVRKQLVSVFGNTQSNMDVDVRVRTKMMIYMYLFGSRVDGLSPVYQKTISGLTIGRAWVDWGHSIYGEIKFPAYYPVEPSISALQAY